MKTMKTFVDAKTFVKTLGITSITKWAEYCISGDKPDDIPSSPNIFYKNDGWDYWEVFLGLCDSPPKDKPYQYNRGGVK